MSSYLYTPSSSPPVVTPPDNENNNPHDISRRSSDDSTFGPYIPATSYDKRDKVIVVHIIMQIKPEWVEDVKFMIKKIKRWAQAHEPGLLTFRATLSVDNPNELRLFQEYRNLDAYRVHESNPYMREMMECLGNYLEDESEMEFIEGEEFAI